MAHVPQTYKNHAKLVPAFHYFVLPVLLVNIIIASRQLFQAPGLETVWGVLFAVALFMLGLFARVFALKAQDRVIRLEMRLRLREVLPADQRAQIGTLTTEQLIGLRFASDAELPGLVSKVLKDGIDKRKPIKLMVTDWQGDYQRV